MKISIIKIAVFLSLLICAVIADPACCQPKDQHNFKVGVLAKRGASQCLKKWGGTAYYLGAHLPGCKFSIVPLNFYEIESAVKNEEVDFVLANPAFYVKFEALYGVTRIATLKNKRLSRVTTHFGGVVFCRSDRKDIQTVWDLKDKDFMAVSRTSFGGWYAAWRYLLTHGINPDQDFSHLSFGETHDSVVFAVRDGKVDAGTVRTDILERMASEGKITIEDFRILGERRPEDTGFPFLVTTRLYPEWPFAKLPHVSSEIAEKVAAALFKMEPDYAAALEARCAGWTIPLNYEPVRKCLKFLKVGPYKDQGELSLSRILREYWLIITAFTMAFLFLGFLAVYLKRLNIRYHDIIERLKSSEKEKEKMHAELLHAQKLEAVGQLAAGIAHEINTPAQYVGSNIDFFEDAFGDIQDLVKEFKRLFHEANENRIEPDTLSEVEAALDKTDWDYLEPELFEAIDQSKEGIKRITTIVRAMKEFSHPGSRSLEPGDLNRLIETTVTVAKNEWKYVADVKLCFDKALPPVPCYSDQLGQVILNIIINASHAIADKLGENPEGRKGIIAISTYADGKWAVIKIEDTGTGIPDDIIDKIFEPFFTTKDVGKGTGQGLAIAFDVVTAKHNGRIDVSSRPGEGTTFTIRLPLAPPSDSRS